MVGTPTASGHERRSTRHKYAAYPPTMSHASGRPRPASAPSANAASRVGRCNSVAPGRSATTSGSTFPAHRNRTHVEQARRASAASAPASTPPAHAPRRKASTMATRPAQRTTTSHRLGAAPPNRPSGAVNSTGSGFQPVGEIVLSAGPGPTISRPNTTQAHGSTDGTPGSASEPPATAPHAPHARAPNRVPRRDGQ
jgi:hypothetical protein